MDKALNFVRWAGLLPAAISGSYLAVWLLNSLMPNAGIDPSGELGTVTKFVVATVCFLFVSLWIAPHHKQQTLIALLVFGVAFLVGVIWRTVANM